MKPYLYGGIALLIVGLFSAAAIFYYKAEAAELELFQARETNYELQRRVASLVLREDKKQEAAQLYLEAVEKLNKATQGLQKAAYAYTARNTENEKCLDLVPPTDFIRMLYENSIQGQGDLHSSKPIPVNSD